jgi:tetratricopeptide (TPR) repeat protein
MTALLVVLATSQVACVVGPRFTRCPGEGGRAWVRLDSDHYTLETDLPPEEARKAMTVLERSRIAILAAMWPGLLAQPMSKVRVYTLQDPDEFEGLYPRRVQAFFYRSDTEAFIVLPGPPASWERRFSGLSQATSSRLEHELTHFLSTHALPRQPRWLSEGLAEYLETLRVSEDGQTAVVGAPHYANIAEMGRVLGRVQANSAGGWTMQRLLAWEPTLAQREQDRQVLINYAASWLLVHWLSTHRPEQFAAYQGLIAKGLAPDAAMKEALPELESRALDGELLEYLRNRRFPERTVRVPPTGTGFVEEVIEHADVHAIRSRLAEFGAQLAWREPFIGNRRKLSRDELAESLRLNPTGLLALALKQHAAPEAERPAISRAAVEAHPNDARAWLLRASALAPDAAAKAEQEAAYQKALELEPRSMAAATGLAWLYVTQGRLAEALPLAQVGITLAPWSTYAVDTYAMVLAGGGACDAALQLEQRALELIQEDANPELERRIQERLDGLTSGTLCTPAPASP